MCLGVPPEAIGGSAALQPRWGQAVRTRARTPWKRDQIPCATGAAISVSATTNTDQLKVCRQHGPRRVNTLRHDVKRVGHEHIKRQRDPNPARNPYRRDRAQRAFIGPLADERAPQDHQHSDRNRREHGPPPRQRQQEEDVPVEQRRRPATHGLEKHVVENVPDTERDRAVPESRLPRPARQHADGEQHDEGRGFAHELDLSQDSAHRQRIRLIGLEHDRPGREGSRRWPLRARPWRRQRPRRPASVCGLVQEPS